MEFKFDKRIENFLKIILKNAQKIGLRVFFVGGIVRDNILNIKTSDIDILVLGNAIEFAKKLPDEIKIASFHKDFCTVKVEYDNLQIDIASSRTELYPYSGCLPVLDSVGVSLEDDVLRRDFTVNSLYCELKLVNNVITYELIDLINGLADIKNKTLKVLHKKSYIDDPTRILRGLDLQLDVMRINIIDVVTSILLIYFGVPYMGTFGYILVIYVSEYLNGLFSINLLLKKIKLNFNYFDWLFIPCILLFISFFITKLIIPSAQNIVSLSLSILSLSLIFAFLYVVYMKLSKKNKA